MEVQDVKTFLALAAALLAAGGAGAASVTVPAGAVEEVVDLGERTYPARVVPVAEVNLVPQVSGEILEVGFKNGAAVEKGDVLYRIDPVKYEAALKNAEARVAGVKSNLEYAKMQTERFSELVKSRAVPQDDLDRARSSYNAYCASLAAAQAELLAAEDDGKHCKGISPIGGRAGSTAFTEGNFVTRGGPALVRIVQTDPVRVSFAISSADYDAAAASDPRRMAAEGAVRLARVAGGETIATGRVEYVENAAEAATDSVRLFALVENPRGTLLAGQTVMATLFRAAGTPRAAVPPNAVALDDRGTYVWVLDGEGRAKRRTVVRGQLQKGRQIVLSGLVPGERIVFDGVHRVKEGDVVTAER